MAWQDMNNSSQWNSRPVSHCLSKGPPLQGECEVQFNIIILTIVSFMNLVKVICISTLLFRRSDVTIAVIGDAMKIFLQSPDDETKGECLLSQADLWKKHRPDKDIARQWRDNDERLWRAASRRRWGFALFSYVSMALLRACAPLNIVGTADDGHRCFAMIVVGIAFLSVGLSGYRQEQLGSREILTDRLGKESTVAVVGTPISHVYGNPAVAFAVAVIFSNIFQSLGEKSCIWSACRHINQCNALISASLRSAVAFLYFMINSLLTCLRVAQEWGRFDGLERKALRVSHSRGIQRSTYFLSLPYKYSGLLILSATLLHWFLSQSVFPVRTSYLTLDGKRDPGGDGTVIGYSVLGIILSFSLGCITLIAILKFSYSYRYRSIIPMASTSSLAISAACHRPAEDTEAHLLPLRWGVVSWDGRRGVGHCAFSTKADRYRPKRGQPQQNHEYA